MQTRRDRDINTVWTTEHLLKDLDDLDAFLELPVFGAGETVDPTALLKAEAALGETRHRDDRHARSACAWRPCCSTWANTR